MVSRRSFISGLASGVALAGVSSLSRAEIPRHSIPDEIETMILSGFEEPGDAGRGALYVRGQPGGLLAIQDGDGGWWNLRPGVEVWAGWFGAIGRGDDTTQFQAAIDYVSSLPQGGVVNIAGGLYKLNKTAGAKPIGARDDGRHPDARVPPLPEEAIHEQAYCLSLPKNVTLQGHGNVVFRGAYKYGEASLEDTICICISGSRTIYYVGISNIKFESYFFAIACVERNTIVLSKFEGLTFSSCAIGFYACTLERCFFDDITANGTGCVIAVGGQWSSRENRVLEGGGFADKCNIGVLHNIYGRVFGDAERGIDTYFDEYFFKSQNNSSRLVVLNDLGSSIARALSDRSPATHFSYKGICGRSVYIMARHGRPSNANYFRMITHAFAPRAAVWIDHAVACSGEIVYLEGCGYKDNVKRKGPIGVEVTDPYLGDGVRVPAFVRGYTCMLDAQFVFGQRLATRNELPDRFAFWCDLIDRQDARVFRDKVNVDALTVRGEARSGAATGGVTVISRSLDPTWRKVHVKVPGGDGGASRTALVIVNSEFSQDDAKSTVYILTVHGKNISSGRLYGEDVLTFSQELDDMVSISSLRPAKHSVAVIMTGSEDQ